MLIPNELCTNKIQAVSTTRLGGVSISPYNSLNLGMNTQDDPHAVLRNRTLLSQSLALPSEPLWLNQVHGIHIVDVDKVGHLNEAPTADGAIAFARPGPSRPCVVTTADCGPLLLADSQGMAIAALHCGWKSVAGGIIKECVNALGLPPSRLKVWLGPCIGPNVYEVGADLKSKFMETPFDSEICFTPLSSQGLGREDQKWLFNLPLYIKRQCQELGISDITLSGVCTYTQHHRFYSYRRSPNTGRFASLIWFK